MFYSISDDLLDRYDYSTDEELKDKLHAWDRTLIRAMMTYASGLSKFGQQMTTHQNRTGKIGRDFMLSLGYSEKAAKNFRAAMFFHDIGKTHPNYNPGIWSLWERPSPEEKAEQKKHARRGADMFETLADQIGISSHPHFKVRHAVTLYHHERRDGTGPEGYNVTTLPQFVQISCIIDAYDGDMIHRPHQPRARTPQEAAVRLMGLDGSDKYKGAFDSYLIRKFGHFIAQKHGFTL